MKNILTSSGSSLQYGQAEISKQDASILGKKFLAYFGRYYFSFWPFFDISVFNIVYFTLNILGWTCGNGISSGLDAALFVYDLLSPAFYNDQDDDQDSNVAPRRRQEVPIVSKQGLQDMLNFTTLNTGWAKNEVDYGGGIMVQNVNLKYAMPPFDNKPPPHHAPLTYFGHGGDTYGFMSDSGYYPLLNASVAVIVNQDSDYIYPRYVKKNCFSFLFTVFHSFIFSFFFTYDFIENWSNNIFQLLFFFLVSIVFFLCVCVCVLPPVTSWRAT